MRPSDNINDLIKKLQLKASADLDRRVHEDISPTPVGYEETKSVRSEPSIWRTIMKGKTAKLTAAAVILTGVLVLTGVFVQTDRSVVLAGVLEKVEQARAFAYNMEMTMTGDMVPAGKQVIQGTTVISKEYGMKWEMDMPDPNTGERRASTMVYVLPDQKVMFLLRPERKKYVRMELDDDLLARMKKESNDPRMMIKKILNCEYTETGRKVIDGTEVQGFETTDPQFAAGTAQDVRVALWVDVHTWLPMLWEMDMRMNEQTSMHVVTSDFRWDIPVAASDFEPVIPEDYTTPAGEGYKAPSLSEEVALEGLKSFAEVSGRYPEKIDFMSLMGAFEKLADAGRKRDSQMNLDQVAREENTKKATDVFRQIQSLALFYATLVQDKKEPVYYGETVGPDDTDAVLMRWKISAGRYRVVFGDLATSDVTPEELAELEKSQFE